jgi:hypothetical protein
MATYVDAKRKRNQSTDSYKNYRCHIIQKCPLERRELEITI